MMLGGINNPIEAIQIQDAEALDEQLGSSPLLLWAIAAEQRKSIETLIMYGADPHLRLGNRPTVWEFAHSQGCPVKGSAALRTAYENI